MLSKLSILSVALLPLVACGGDDGVMVKRPDAKIFMDAPPPPPCSVQKSFALGLQLGASDDPVLYAMGSLGWFRTPTEEDGGPYVGKPIWTMSAALPDPQGDQNLRDIWVVEVLKPQAGFQTNTPYVNDPDPVAAAPIARSYIFGDVDTSTGEFIHLYWASTGQTSFTQITEAPDANIFGATSTLNYREIDEQNADVAGGCTAKISSLKFYLKNTEDTAATGKAQDMLLTERLLKQAHKRLAQ
jgi:hypothetical protein